MIISAKDINLYKNIYLFFKNILRLKEAKIYLNLKSFKLKNNYLLEKVN